VNLKSVLQDWDALHALLLSGSIASLGWLDLLPIRFVMFEEVQLAVTSGDRVVWRFAQANQMILLTANRSMKGENSLEQVMREENTSTSLPVITIGDADRVLTDPDYRNRCVDQLIEIIFDIDDYRGTMRLFIP
jgi:hypothetical protein